MSDKIERVTDAEEADLSAIFARLDELLSALEREEHLERSFQLYAEGVGLVKAANERIDRVEKQVKVLDEDGIL